jgi:hypothetical protein
MTDYPNEERIVEEWGMMLDCAENGCEGPHSDDGMVSNWSTMDPSVWGKPTNKIGKINSHAAVRVKRTVTYSKWERA